MPEFDNKGTVALWRNKSDNPKAPQATGVLYAHRDIREGEAVDIALWKSEAESERQPVMRGRIQDRREAAPTPEPSQDFDGDIPF